MAGEDEAKTNETTDSPLKPGDPGYEEAMVKRFDDAHTDPEARDEEVAPMPEGGSEKFYNAETGEYNWQAHAKELQFKIDQKGEKPEDPKTPQDGEGDDGDDTKENEDGEPTTVSAVLEQFNLNQDTIVSVIQEHGDLPAEAKDALEAAGLPAFLVDEYVFLLKNALDTAHAQALDYVGGKEEWNALSDWAAQNMSDEDKVKINKLLDSPDWKMGIDLVRAKRGEANPLKGESKLQAGTTGSGGSIGYKSRDEMKADMSSDRYKKDAAFRAEVSRRIAVSTYPEDRALYQ